MYVHGVMQDSVLAIIMMFYRLQRHHQKVLVKSLYFQRNQTTTEHTLFSYCSARVASVGSLLSSTAARYAILFKSLCRVFR